MLQRPYGEYMSIGAPKQPNVLNDMIGYDIFLQPLATIETFDAPSSNATSEGSSVNQGTDPLDTGLKVTEIVNDEKGNPWYKVIDNSGAFSLLNMSGSTVYVPASPLSVPKTSLDPASLETSVQGYLYNPATAPGQAPSGSPTPTPSASTLQPGTGAPAGSPSGSQGAGGTESGGSWFSEKSGFGFGVLTNTEALFIWIFIGAVGFITINNLVND